jgi:hypothetical protein
MSGKSPTRGLKLQNGALGVIPPELENCCQQGRYTLHNEARWSLSAQVLSLFVPSVYLTATEAMNQHPCVLVLSILVLSRLAAAQSPDFLHPTQTGPFQVNGLSFVEFSITGPQSGFLDPLNLGSGPVTTLDQIVSEIKATGTNLVKINLTLGQMKSPTDNAYDPSVPFPLEGTASNVIAFGQKLVAQGIPCMMVGLAPLLEKRPNPSDPRAFMAQHIPRLVSTAQIAESAGCEYFILYSDDLEGLTVNSNLVDLWTQAANQVRAVFSGRLTSCSTWGGQAQGYWWGNRPPEIAAIQDVFGIEFGSDLTNQADPTVAELVATYQSDSQGVNTLQGVADTHALYGKPILITDIAFASFPNAAMSELSLFELQPGSVWPPVDYQAQVNLYQAFFQAMATLDPTWFWGGGFDSIDRLPYSWKDTHLPAYLGSPGESLRGKPALQTLTQGLSGEYASGDSGQRLVVQPVSAGHVLCAGSRERHRTLGNPVLFRERRSAMEPGALRPKTDRRICRNRRAVHRRMGTESGANSTNRDYGRSRRNVDL